MQSFNLQSLISKELYKDVFIRLKHGKDLTLNYFELKNQTVSIPLHSHPVEHLVIVLKGEMEFIFEDKTLMLKEKICLFIPAKIWHTAKVKQAPVKALEIYNNKEDHYYDK